MVLGGRSGQDNGLVMKSLTRHMQTKIAWAAGAVLVAALAITIALLVTPLQQVSLAGQTVGVGAAAPSFSVSGPGELDLFGQRLPTTLDFAGPVRPRLALTQITLGRQLATAFAPGQQSSERAIGEALASGWKRYFGWEIAITGGAALVLSGALAGWLRLRRKSTIIVLAVGLAVAEIVNLGGIMATAYTAPARLRQVSSIAALAGRTPLPSVPRPPGPPHPQVHVVVMGDSTAAGIGNPRPNHPSKLDLACGRSVASYAVDLGQINNWKVLNLACSGATIPAGILGSQGMPDATAPPQFGEAKKATMASYVIVSIGADDVGWSALLQLCAVTTCDDKASTAYFQQQLASFTVEYYQLLRRLAALPSNPTVLVNLYYNPFDTTAHCLDDVGLTPEKENSLIRLLSALNNVLENGARETGLVAVRPDFSGHAICDPEPYVQGLHGRAPFHPTVAGQLAIALADSDTVQRIQESASPSASPNAQPGSPSPSSGTATP
jgi:GDSL-like Lipase/Acylhydrolase family